MYIKGGADERDGNFVREVSNPGTGGIDHASCIRTGEEDYWVGFLGNCETGSQS